MKCDTVRNGLHAYLDGLLTPDEKEGIERHLAECAECRPPTGS